MGEVLGLRLDRRYGGRRARVDERPAPRLFADGSWRYRSRLFLMILATVALWAILYCLARLLFF